VDSANVQPLVVDSIQIFAGQRYSFVLHADQPISNYWIRALPNNGPPGFANGVNSAILRYVGAPNVDPQTTQPTSLHPLVEFNLRPLVKAPAPGPPALGAADVSINLDIALDSTGLFNVNNASFVPPSVPVLLQMLSGAQAAQALLPSGSVYSLPSNKVVELTIPGGSIGSPV
jgi:iron transport multicopper oxidase